MKKILLLTFGAVLVALGAYCNSYLDRGLDVPYVPTPQTVVDTMLEMADVSADDIVYDLGCGDGRIVITAVRDYGATGIGIDLDPDRIDESRKNAREAEIEDRIDFIQGDIFEADISEATVVTMYLLHSVNLKLRPKLFRDLEPGTRIVSHDFSMGDWLADEHTMIGGNVGGSHTVYFWVLPANLNGTWNWTAGSGGESVRYHLTVDQRFQEPEGELTAGGDPVTISDMSVEGKTVTFTVESSADGATRTSRYEGTVEGNTIRGSILPAGGNGSPAAWTARRQPGTSKPIIAGSGPAVGQ